MGQQTASVATLTRPADTTAYTSGDSVANSTSAPTPIEFTGLGRSGVFTGTLYGVEMDDQNNAGTPGEFELWLFSSSPTIANDNAAAARSRWPDLPTAPHRPERPTTRSSLTACGARAACRHSPRSAFSISAEWAAINIHAREQTWQGKVQRQFSWTL